MLEVSSVVILIIIFIVAFVIVYTEFRKKMNAYVQGSKKQPFAQLAEEEEEEEKEEKRKEKKKEKENATKIEPPSDTETKIRCKCGNPRSRDCGCKSSVREQTAKFPFYTPRQGIYAGDRFHVWSDCFDPANKAEPQNVII